MAESSDADWRLDETVEQIVFAPIGGEALPQQTVRRIAEAISLGLLRQGDRLPPSSQLAEWFGISTMTLREALAILRQAGYVEIVRGRNGGTFVRGGPAPPSDAEARRSLGKYTAQYLSDLTDMRVAVDGEASALAAQRATPDEAQRLVELAEELGKTKKYSTYRQLDAKFHITIASAARSPRLTSMETELQVELGEIFGAVFPLMADRTDPVLRASNREHKRLARAIADRDHEGARKIAVSHASGSRDLQVALILSITSS